MEISQSTVALITGASTGIGEALALELAPFGAKIAICARRADKLQEVADRIQQAGGTPLVIACDISDREAAIDAVRQTVETFGRLDILVNNAGRGNLASVEDTTTEQLESMFSLNVYALFHTTAAALPVMKKQSSGHIINVASVAGKMAFPFNSAYVAAKHAVVGFTAALRAELVETGVEATVICPDGVETSWAQVTEGGPIGDIFVRGIRASRTIARERGLPLSPLQPLMKPQEIASIILRTILTPGPSDVFTHPGTYELSVEAATDRKALEQKFLPLYLGMREAYREVRQSDQ
jgi:short-subunit dehydrogenase